MFVLYASASTLSLLLLLASSIFAHHTHPSSHRLDLASEPLLPAPKARPCSSLCWPWPRVARALALGTRRAGKLVAYANTAFILTANVAQYSNQLDNCWCNSRVAGLGAARAYAVIEATMADLGGIQGGWIGGLCLGTCVVVLFVVFVHVLLDGKAD